MRSPEKLQLLMDEMSDGLVKEEDLKPILEVLAKAMKDVRIKSEQLLLDTKNASIETIAEMKSEMDILEKYVNKISLHIESCNAEMMKEMKAEMENMKAMIPDETDFSPIEQKLSTAILDIEKKIPKLPEELTAEKIRDKLETLKGNERLEKSAIKGLEDELKRLEGQITSSTGERVIGRRKTQWSQKNLSGLINGSNKTYTFEGPEPMEFSERVFLNYVEQNPLTDYTIAGKTITYTTAPDASLTGLAHIIRYAY